ncbi:SGNH/GDSL hydrolase family protein [Streptomyces sp. MST-110588]|uniref:SGNH/GDSL hydrolase family protein n=1 Tax=Streptomyces sp. MST-110588 TaxID=2833628 RepID=UPI001F5DC038|nr:SGNH/GDSL hydrolase family protein [Streptomyces sp. MST-110588]UNO39319.1 SGNH/GDSL hydrolase family protein [Streptomyces sp. MST-110588]
MRVRLWGTALVLALSGTVSPAAAAPPRPDTPAPLEELFDNTAISEDTDPGDADFDGAGRSLSAQDLRAAGWTPGRLLAIDSARLTWPRSEPGEPDNVRADGQAVRVRGQGGALSLLVAATAPGPGGTVTGTGTVRYRDGSRSTYELSAPDWRTGPLSTKAVALPHLNSPEGQQAGPARLYAVSVPLRPGREVSSVVLPQDPGPAGDLHVFAVGVRDAGRGWTASWAASTGGYPAVGPWTDRTLRLVVHAGAGGPRARIRLANTFAAAPVTIGAASVAVQGQGAQAAGRPVPLTFQGRRSARIPAGAQVFGDPVDFAVPAGANLLVSIHLPGTVTAAPVHQMATQRSYLSAPGSGDRTGDGGGAAFTGTLETWPFLTGVDVRGGPGTVVTLGDSITDGARSTAGANRRWPDVLAERLRAQDTLPRYGVANHGIGANRVVTDRYQGDGVSKETGGVSALHRLDRDVLAQPGVRTVIVFEGVNDLLGRAAAPEVTAGLRAIARRAHERGLRVLAATVAPCEGFVSCTPAVEAQRSAVNTFVRNNVRTGDCGAFDAVLDFDAVVRDPRRPQRIAPTYDSGDHLHPGDAGLRALAESVDLRLLVP